MLITIITGKKDTGKSTWCRRNLEGEDVDGVILTKVYNAAAVEGYDALRLGTGERIPLLRRHNSGSRRPFIDEDTSEAIGQFVMSGRKKATVVQWVEDAWNGSASRIVIDEVGRLELRGGGFAPLLSRLLASANTKELVLVVREDYLSEALSHFCISNARIIRIENGEIMAS